MSDKITDERLRALMLNYGGSEVNAVCTELLSLRHPEPCVWTKDADGNYATSCGKHIGMAVSDWENPFCHECGHPIQAKGVEPVQKDAVKCDRAHGVYGACINDKGHITPHGNGEVRWEDYQCLPREAAKTPAPIKPAVAEVEPLPIPKLKDWSWTPADHESVLVKINELVESNNALQRRVSELGAK